MYALLLGQRVEEGAQHGNTRADAAQKGHGRLEHDARGHDDHHTLERVGHRVRHGGQLVEGQEGELVVQVEVEA